MQEINNSALRVLVLLSALANLSFKKNIIAGAFEFGSFVFLIGSSQQQKLFYATIAALVLECGYLFHTTTEIWQMATSAAIAGLALTLLVNDIVAAMQVSMNQSSSRSPNYSRYQAAGVPALEAVSGDLQATPPQS